MFPGSVAGSMGNNETGGADVVGNRLIFPGRQGKVYDLSGPLYEYRKMPEGGKDPFGGKGYQCGPFEAVM